MLRRRLVAPPEVAAAAAALKAEAADNAVAAMAAPATRCSDPDAGTDTCEHSIFNSELLQV
jgi:hypothetical protein